uniref:Uncharacterized protein n=1 Tax=Arundo donax TaxID=35708 RepID=A0A0A9HMA6_ARUDO
MEENRKMRGTNITSLGTDSS